MTPHGHALCQPRLPTVDNTPLISCLAICDARSPVAERRQATMNYARNKRIESVFGEISGVGETRIAFAPALRAL